MSYISVQSTRTGEVKSISEKEFLAMTAKQQTDWMWESSNETDCKCGKDSTGWTQVKCCNICGKSIEPHWKANDLVLDEFMGHALHNKTIDATGKDGTFNTFSGRSVSLYDPTPEMICIEDIAHALSHVCRFGGHTREFYSVAQHSCLVSYLAPAEWRLAALMHDATEAYLGDVIRPLKNILNGKRQENSAHSYTEGSEASFQPAIYKEIESVFERVIAKKFGIDHTMYGGIKPYDIRALEIEHGYFFLHEPRIFSRCFNSEEPCWTPTIAKEVFISTFNELTA